MSEALMVKIASEVFESLDVAEIEMIGCHPIDGEVFIVKNSPIKMYCDLGFSFAQIMMGAANSPVQLNFSHFVS